MHDTTTTDERLGAIEAHLAKIAEEGGVPPARFLSIEAAATYSGISAVSLRRLISAGKIERYTPIKGRVVVDRLELENYVRSCTVRARTGRGIRRAGRAAE